VEIRFFSREVENPVLRFLLALGAAVFAAALAGVVLVILLPLLGTILTGVLLVVAVVLALLVVFLPFIAFLGVVFSRGKKGSGVIQSETRELEPFTSLRISGAAEIRAVCGDQQSVMVSTDDNLLELVETSVKGGELAVGFSKPVTATSSLKVYITLKELKKLKTQGASKVFLEEIKTDELSIRAGGASRIEASGTVNTLSLKISGAGKYNGAELYAEQANVTIKGAGNARIHAGEKLSVNISGAGRVVCSGNPGTVEKHISGAGTVVVL